jgi:hypothetical protein
MFLMTSSMVYYICIINASVDVVNYQRERFFFFFFLNETCLSLGGKSHVQFFSKMLHLILYVCTGRRNGSFLESTDCKCLNHLIAMPSALVVAVAAVAEMVVAAAVAMAAMAAAVAAVAVTVPFVAIAVQMGFVRMPEPTIPMQKTSNRRRYSSLRRRQRIYRRRRWGIYRRRRQ